MTIVSLEPAIYQLVVRYFGNTNATNAREGSLQTNGCGAYPHAPKLFSAETVQLPPELTQAKRVVLNIYQTSRQS